MFTSTTSATASAKRAVCFSNVVSSYTPSIPIFLGEFASSVWMKEQRGEVGDDPLPTSPLSRPSVPSMSQTRVQGSTPAALDSQMPWVVWDLCTRESRHVSRVTCLERPLGMSLRAGAFDAGRRSYLPLNASISTNCVPNMLFISVLFPATPIQTDF